MLMQPSQADVRQFFCSVYQKMLQQQPLQPIEQMASYWISQHPEYHADLADIRQALAQMTQITTERENPFLHLSMHLSISEQYSIDQPPGIRQAIDQLAAKLNSLHLAHHEIMQALGNMLWQSQHSGQPPDGQSYLAQIQQRITKL